MTKVIVSDDICDQLQSTRELIEICKNTGEVLGYFYQSPTSLTVPVQAPHGVEETQRRRLQRTGRPLADILKDLGAT